MMLGLIAPGPIPLRDDPRLLAQINAAMRELQDAGLVKRDRALIDAETFAFVSALLVDGAPVAFVAFYECEKAIVWVDLIYTAPAFRRRGLASALLRRVGAFAADHRMRRVMLGTGIDNVVMQAVANCAGFFSHHVVMAKVIVAPVNELAVP